MTVKYVIKRDGRQEDFQPEKLNKWCNWAANNGVPWDKISLEVYRLLGETVTSKEIQETILYVCNQSDDKRFHDMAARVMIGIIYKEVFNGAAHIPDLKTYYYSMVARGLWADMGYSAEELDVLGKLLDHNYDFKYSFASLKQMYEKYLLKNEVTLEHYESPQFMNMGIAMHNMRNMPKSRRLEDVANTYNFLKENKISLPTPILASQRTGIDKFASCCLITCADEADSIGIENYIAYSMTTAHAGIGGYLGTRSLGDPVNNGMIKHEGKLPYLEYMKSAIGSTKQKGRRGAGTFYFTCHDPEIKTLLELKHVNTPDSRQIRELDFAMNTNKLIVEKALKGEDWMLVSEYYAPKLYELFFSDNQKAYRAEYERVKNDKSLKKTFIKAREVINLANKQWQETGRIYKTFIDNMNHHTPFKEPIHSSNLCVHGGTSLLTSKGEFMIKDLVGKYVKVWNGLHWSESVVEKTGENQKLVKVLVENQYDDQQENLWCTPYHKFYDHMGNEIRAHQLKAGTHLLRWVHPTENTHVYHKVLSVTDVEGLHDTYCVNEPVRHKAVFNGILTGQCLEIALPTKPFHNIQELFSTDDQKDLGEIALCFISAIPAGRVTPEEYEKVAYYVLLILDNVIDEMEYPFPQLAMTAKNRRSVGVGIINLAHHMAKSGQHYNTPEGLQFIHDHAEMHSYYLHKASLKLAKERGVAKWIDKTHYPDGWLPIDTYAPAVDELANGLHFDWEALRAEIIAEGGIRNSVLEATMPAESSAIKADATNSVYPIRDFMIKKGNKENLLKVFCPDYDDLWTKINYDKFWNLSVEDFIKFYAVIQKFHGQAISADFPFNPSHFAGGVKTTTQQLKETAMMVKYGLKTHYYLNTLSAGDKPSEVVEEDDGCSSGACKL